MRETEMNLIWAARDYCDAAERMTTMRRLAAQPCENADPPDVPRCHQWRPEGKPPESEWCDRCKTFTANRHDYLTQRRVMRNALRRMRYWRAKEDR